MATIVLIMTLVVVFISTIVNFGFNDPNFWIRFIRGWILAFVIAFPIVVVIMPGLQKYFQKFVN
ncbi:MAG: DUF2798 domain-containing protein [Calditerrivibrio sp.]|uniref:DUF2798 domain-containing protein n=1 Tax=Calditerrivibrio sp. TaxID=2792612 RepID=UPI003D127692